MSISEAALSFLKQRGFTDDLIERLNLSSTWRGHGDAEAEWIVIPYEAADGSPSGCKYRRVVSLETGNWSQDPGGVKVFYRRPVIADPGLIDDAGKPVPLIITEGEWDTMAALAAGFQRVISVPNGAPAERGTAKHDYIGEAWDDLKHCNEVILATDNDGPGENLRADLIHRFGRPRCKVANYPKGCKDLNDALMRYGVRGVQESIKRAELVPVDGVYEFGDLPDEPPLNPCRVRSLGPEFEKHIGICKGHVSFWTGWANRGKTALIRNVMMALAYEHDWRIGAAMFEDGIRRTFAPAIRRSIARTDTPSVDQIARADPWIAEHFRFIIPPDDIDVTVPWFIERAEVAVRRHSCDMIVLDPWTELDLQTGGNTDANELIKLYLTHFTKFARVFNVHVAIVAHPRKAPEIGGTKKMPAGYDISGSAHFMNKCHLGVTVQSDETTEGLTDVWVWKSKWKEIMGPTGKFALEFDPITLRFSGIDWVRAEQARGKGAEVVDFSERRKDRE